ncbi:NAD-dependent epimerase/dehydratase [Bifidobacterium actinocoloniiforme DSM 22766]|uniref:NAD-dependent epimerase/dehydratase n=1 Tax=Bifidobacterium actinocoloniiforme DSM 22766 TaxID=1437605 RepID=A0A086Z059_9BIFI|nr:NAD(P)H-binding protein [Bifidobacterium actinocoloniiforme]AKV55170.1 NAD(P)-dependent oxidoreductase [Bifidobacterium actinocoloniiforme DSM 22766]KFI39909.1 NAD-dependent epimerase/dehydratase [Bifidobacterium actinocoloniiforme DSM 22766]
MTAVLIIGATGTVGAASRKRLLEGTSDRLTLMARHTRSLQPIDASRERIVSGSVTDPELLEGALKGQDAVLAALSGDLTSMAHSLVEGMDQAGVKRLIFISSMGIYDEIPDSVGASGNLSKNPILRDYRQAADLVEGSDLDYTVIRPGWFIGGDDPDYQITHKGEPFGGHDVCVSSIADLVARLIHEPGLGHRESLGINKKP